MEAWQLRLPLPCKEEAAAVEEEDPRDEEPGDDELDKEAAVVAAGKEEVQAEDRVDAMDLEVEAPAVETDETERKKAERRAKRAAKKAEKQAAAAEKAAAEEAHYFEWTQKTLGASGEKMTSAMKKCLRDKGPEALAEMLKKKWGCRARGPQRHPPAP